MILAEITGLETAGIISGLVFGGAGSLVALLALLKKADVQVSPQPLNVEIVKSLQERFASQADFEALLTANIQEHTRIIRKIEGVERDARSALGAELSLIHADRARTMEKLHEQFTFIRESLSAINTELKLNRRRD